MNSEMYDNGTYAALNPTWHEEDADWKASIVGGAIRGLPTVVHSVCDVGCGTGGVLRALRDVLPMGTELVGFEVSPQARRLGSLRPKAGVVIEAGSLNRARTRRWDVALALDVVEHVEDCHGFLRGLGAIAEWKIVHIPLDSHVQGLMRGLPERVRASCGHLHCFSVATAVALLHECGYELASVELTRMRRGWIDDGVTGALAEVARRGMEIVDRRAAAKWLGGFSLLAIGR